MIHVWVALVIAVVAWAGLRSHSGAKFQLTPYLLLDAAIAVWCWAVVCLATDRLLLGSIILAFGAFGLALANDAKFAALRERLAFSDRAELLEVVRHPEMYLPFAGTGLVLSCVGVLALLLGPLEWVEPPLLPHWWLAPLLLVAVGSIYFSLAIRPVLQFLGHLFGSWTPACVPDADISRFGLMACFVIHATLARFERDSRRAPYAMRGQKLAATMPVMRSVILVQFESFFDPWRLGSQFGGYTPNWQVLKTQAIQFGNLSVPCWGANTIRTEFAALAGIDVRLLGLDQYNPYERFARKEVDSLAWEMRHRGARTLCIHPFDPNFYSRSAVMPKLGFEKFVGPDAFRRLPGERYVTDEAIAAHVTGELREAKQAGVPVFIFAITIAAHGPWQDCMISGEDHAKPGFIKTYLEAVQRMDATMPQLIAAAQEHDAVLAVYGDHQPSLPKAFASIGFSDSRTDYVIYDPRVAGEERPGAARRDLAAHELRSAIQRLLDRETAETQPAVMA